DKVLSVAAERLSRALAAHRREFEEVMLARFGGDEFIAILRHRGARSLGLRLAAACCAALKEPIAHENIELYATASIGVSVYPDAGGDVATVVKHADTAMYHAKSSAVPVAVYAPAMSSRLHDWFDLEARLRRAVADDRLHLNFQPKFRLRDDR